MLLCLIVPQAVTNLALERAANIAASRQEASQQLDGSMQQLQGTQQTISSAVQGASEADAALATQLASNAASVREEANGRHLIACCFCVDSLPKNALFCNSSTALSKETGGSLQRPYRVLAVTPHDSTACVA
jgi:hypothetical protein